MKRRIPNLLLTGTLAGLLTAFPAESAWANAILPPGIIIRPEDRFDPAIQRLLAEHSLRLLPLRRGQLYYLYPVGATPRFEGAQIRYLEHLLDKQAVREALEATEESGALTSGQTEDSVVPKED